SGAGVAAGDPGDLARQRRGPAQGAGPRRRRLHREAAFRPGRADGDHQPDCLRGRMATARTRVMIVEDSSVVAMLLEEIVRSHPGLDLVASVASAEEALRLLPVVKPDVISLDIRLPGIDGLEATRRIMTLQPTPIVVLAAGVDSDDLKISMNALRAGALAVIEKPTVPSAEAYAAVAERICRQLILMSEVPVILQRHRFDDH